MRVVGVGDSNVVMMFVVFVSVISVQCLVFRYNRNMVDWLVRILVLIVNNATLCLFISAKSVCRLERRRGEERMATGHN